MKKSKFSVIMYSTEEKSKKKRAFEVILKGDNNEN